jgi:hypothetical protein
LLNDATAFLTDAFSLYGLAFPIEDTMSKALLKEGLKPPKEKVVKAKPYSEKASVKKAVASLSKMAKTPGSLPL